MSFLAHQYTVRYACSCGQLKPLSRLYFCRHCLKIRCRFCVSHEVDAYFCQTCNENYPSSEAWMKKNSCLKCFICPNCCNTLTPRVITVHLKPDRPAQGENSIEKPEPPKKHYFLVCYFCHWSTRDVGMPDATVATGGWPERESENTEQVNGVLEYFKALALLDKSEKEKKDKKSSSQIKLYSHMSGINKRTLLKRARLDTYAMGLSLPDFRRLPKIESAQAVSDVNDLPENIFSAVPDLNKITSISQRFIMPDCEPETVQGLRPCKRLLLTKTSQRCRACEHNVSKPEYNLGSIKFKIQLSAYYHVTELRLKTCEPLRAGQKSQFVIKLINPTPHQTLIKLLPLNSVSSDCKSESDEPETTSQPPSLLTKVRTIEITPRPVDITLNGSVTLPKESFILPQRDDAAEYDDTGDNHNFNDSPQVVWWRGNKLAIKLEAVPNDDLQVGSQVHVGFMMAYTYINTMIQKKEQQKVDLQVNVIINLGTVVTC